jgi:hypothetical protein
MDPEEAFAIKFTLAALEKLRSTPPLYKTVRGVARGARRLRRR